MKKNIRYMLHGLLADILLVITGTLLFLIILALGYRGKCWDVLAVTLARPCTFYEYLTRDVPFMLLLMLVEYWWLILIALLLPPVVGFLAGRRRFP